MNRYLLFFVFFGLLQSPSILPYAAEKKGVKLVAVDYARTPDALCIEAAVAEWVQNVVGKGIPAQKFLDTGWRPVGVTVTNTTTKPMMLAPFYGKKATAGDIVAPAHSMLSPFLPLVIDLALFSGIAAPISFFVAVDSYRARTVINATVVCILSSLVFAVSTAKIVADVISFHQFYDAMKQKAEELKFVEEALILPGQTIHKLLVCSKEEYISRFPLVVYPLENREEMIVFDVDLRA